MEYLRRKLWPRLYKDCIEYINVIRNDNRLNNYKQLLLYLKLKKILNFIN